MIKESCTAHHVEELRSSISENTVQVNIQNTQKHELITMDAAYTLALAIKTKT